MRRFIWVHAIIFCSFLIVCGLLVRWIHGYQSNRAIQSLLVQARNAEAANQPERALGYLDLYLIKRPGDIEARVLAATVALNERLMQQATGVLQAVRAIENLLQLDPSRSDLRLRLVRILIDNEMFLEARSHLELLGKILPNDGRVEFHQGWLEDRNGRFALAATLYEKARLHDPKLVAAYDRLARLYRIRMNEPVKADAVMDIPRTVNGLLKHNGDQAEAYLTRAIYRRAFKLPDIDQDISKALSLAPKSLNVLINAAREATIATQFDQARSYLVTAETLFPDKAQVYLAQASVEIRAARHDLALEAMRRGIKKLPDDLELQWNNADLLVQLGHVEEAEKVIADFKRMGFNPELTEFLGALTLVVKERWADAYPLLEKSAKMLSAKPDTWVLARRAYLALGRCYAELGNSDLQLAAYRRVINLDASIDDRQTILARSGIAAALVDMGRIDEAIDEYRKTLVLPGAPPDTKIILARLLIFQNLRLLEPYRRWDEIELLLDAASKTLIDNGEIMILRAEALTAQQLLDPAQKLLEKARDDHPDRVELWVALSILSERQERPQEAARILDEADKRLGDKVELRMARAKFWGTQGGPKAAENLAKLNEKIDAFPAARRRELMSAIADAYARLGDLKTSLTIWKKMGDEEPRDIAPRLIQFDMAMQDRDRREVDRVIDEIRAIEGEEGSIWRYARARVLMDQYRVSPSQAFLNEARDLLNLVAQRRPAWSRAPLAQAEVDDIQGNPNVALRGYLRAIHLGDRSPLAIKRSIQILYQQRRYDQANQILRTLQEQLPISNELQRLAADISIQTRDYSKALTQARKAVSNESPDYKDHIWLGQVLWIIGQRAAGEGRKDEANSRQSEATAELRRAVELGRNQPDAWIALIQFLVFVDKRAEAERALVEAEKALPPADAPLALAQANEVIGNSEKVESLYLKALELKPQDTVAIQAIANYYVRVNRMNDAKPYLSRLIDLRSQSPDEANWARRILAIVLANEGNHRQSLKALELLGLSDVQADENRVATEPIDDLRAKVRVLARQKTTSRRREAKRLLEEILRREVPIPDDLFLFGQLLEMEGNWVKAREQFQSVVALMPNDPYYNTEFTLALLRHKLVNDAQSHLKHIEVLKPGSPEVIEIKARLFKAKGQGDQAAALVLDYVKDKDSRLRVSAALLEELGEYKASEELYRRFAQIPAQPENVLVLATFLGRRQRTVEALDLCDQAWSSCSPEIVADACVRIVYVADSNESYYSRVADQFERILKQKPENVALLFELANIRGLQGRINDAKSIYLQAFQRNPQNVASLNNLAWLLAYQQGQGKEAMEYINQAIERHAPEPALLDTRAVVHMALNQPEPAIHDLEEALSVEMTINRQLHLAEAYLLASRRTDAINALNEARRMGLDAKTLHPFERKPYQLLTEQLSKK